MLLLYSSAFFSGKESYVPKYKYWNKWRTEGWLIKTWKSQSSALFHESRVCPLNFDQVPQLREFFHKMSMFQSNLILIDGLKKPNVTFCSVLWFK